MPNLLQKYRSPFFHSLWFLCIAISFFGLGRFSVIYDKKPLTIEERKDIATAILRPEEREPVELEKEKQKPVHKEEIADKETDSPESGTEKLFVASKNGTKYYPSNCKSANRIKEENRVYFKTEQEAQSSGYERTSTCSD